MPHAFNRHPRRLSSLLTPVVRHSTRLGMNLEDLHPELQSIIRQEISANEKILWVGKPRPGALMYASLGLVLFAIPWTAFAIFWVCGASGFKWPTWQGPQSLFPLFGLPFILVGLGMLSSPYWIKRAADRSGYIITNARAVVFSWKLMSAEVSSYSANQLTKMQKKLKPDGSGDIIFDEQSQGSGRYKRIGFIGIDDVKQVEKILREAILHESV